jgi:hypothetical protein
MQVRLKVLQGSRAGQEIRIPGPQCLIGRADECHLRTQSEAVSRRHCTITIRETDVTVRDLGSRNGTYVNGQQVTDETVLLHGDHLRVGPLEFELVVEQTVAKPRRPKVADIREVAARTAGTSENAATAELGNVVEWLEQAEQEEKVKPETRQFRLDETSHDLPLEADPNKAADHETKVDESSRRPVKQAPGKLPPRPSVTSKDSREAAAEMLKKFFNRR